LIFLAGLTLSLLVFIPLIQVVSKEALDFVNKFPAFWEEFSLVFPASYQLTESLSVYQKKIIDESVIFTGNLLSGLGIIVTLLIIIYYMLLDKQNLKNTFLEFFTDETKPRVASVGSTIYRKVGGYITGQSLSMLSIGILTALGFYLIGLDYALLLGIITGILDIIPFVGPIIALLITILTAIDKGIITIIWITVIFAAIQEIDNIFIKSAIFSKVLRLHPLVILFSFLAAGKLLGVIGVIIAPAIAVTAQVLIHELYLKQLKSNEEVLHVE